MASPHRTRPSLTPLSFPPVAGMPVEVWSWLRESQAVRPSVVARVRAALDAGVVTSPDDVALAMLGRASECASRPYPDVVLRA